MRSVTLQGAEFGTYQVAFRHLISLPFTSSLLNFLPSPPLVLRLNDDYLIGSDITLFPLVFLVSKSLNSQVISLNVTWYYLVGTTNTGPIVFDEGRDGRV